MIRMLKKGLLFALAALFVCAVLGCKSSEEKTGKAWGDDTRRNIGEGAESK